MTSLNFQISAVMSSMPCPCTFERHGVDGGDVRHATDLDGESIGRKLRLSDCLMVPVQNVMIIIISTALVYLLCT